MRHLGIMGVIAVACVVAVVNSTMLGPAGRLRHKPERSGGIGAGLMFVGFSDDTALPGAEGPPMVVLLSHLQPGNPALLPDRPPDPPNNGFYGLGAPTGLGAPVSGQGREGSPQSPSPPRTTPNTPDPPTPPPPPSPPGSPVTGAFQSVALVTPPSPVPPGPPVIPPDPPVVPPVTVIIPPPPPVTPPPVTPPGPPLAPAQLTGTLAAPAAIPEPATWAMLVLGMGAAGAMLRRGRRRIEEGPAR
ncbi:MAG: hypothetical protein JWR43_2853 [Phenylobacterium sp.]|nr:hypothetical protein [Phenylobacterium sp.]